MVIKKQFLTLKLGQLKKNLESQNEVFHPSSKILNEMIMKWKAHGDKRSLSYLSKSKTLMSEKITFAKLSENSSFGELSLNQTSKCTTCYKFRYVASKCFSKFFEKYQSHVNRLESESNYLKNQILNIKKGSRSHIKLKKKSN